MQRFWNRVAFISLLLLVSLNSFCQENLISDILFIKDVENEKETTIKRTYIYVSEDNLVKKLNPVNIVFGGLLYLYQNTLSQQFSATCLYNPSCSDFSKQSIQKYGLLKGVFLSAGRIMRCNRIAATGIHPLRVENNKVIDPVTFYKSAK